MARFTTTVGSGNGEPGAPGAPGSNGADGKDSLFLGTWNSVTAFLAIYQGGPVGLADGDWWAFVKDNTDPNKVYVVREDPNSATGWVIDDNESFTLPVGANGADGSSTLLKGSFNYFGDLDVTITNANIGDTYLVLLASAESLAGNLWTWNGTGWTNAGQILGPQGEPGEDGNDGAPGERGISALSWTYKVNTTSLTDQDPGNDYISFNADPFTSATQVKVDDNPYGLNTTLHNLFLSIQSGYLTLTEQSNPSTYATYQITSCVDGTATNETQDGSYVVFNVSLVSTYGAINNEDFVTLSIAPVGQQGAPGADGNEGAPGAPGADALWDYLGEYNGSTIYSAGAVVTYDGQLWYRNVYTSAGYVPGVGNTYWDLLAAKGADGSDANTGDITFDGSRIIGAGTGAGDGSGNGTIELVPDGDITSNQYLIIDPTAPNHIHIRAGGNQDASTADLIFGGERNKVLVSDSERLVLVSTRPPGEEEYENQWIFGSDGILIGPGVDNLLKVNGLYGKDTDPLFLLAPDTVVISGDGGEFLDDATVADNQIATIGDLPTGATGTFTSQDNKTVTVTNGIITSIV
jgi:hypothetical protein